MAQDDDDLLLARFLCGRIDNRAFHHRDHLRVAFAILSSHSFADSAQIYARSLRRIAASAGRPQAYHETITLAFLSLVAERMTGQPTTSFDSFAEANRDLLDKNVLLRWYSGARLASDVARQTFVLP